MFSATDVVTILGKRGSGKTTLGRKIQSVYPRLVIFDRLHEYECEENEEVETFDAFAEKIKWSLDQEQFKIVFRFDIEADNHDEVFNHALRVLYYRGSCCVVVEEVHNFASTHFLPQWFREILLTGRHRELSLILTSQRPAEIHKTLLSQSAHIFCGSMHESNDLRYLSSFMGDDAEKLPHLPQFRFLHFRPGEPSQEISN